MREKLSLSVLLAVKGLQSLEANCTDGVVKADPLHIRIRRWYNGDYDCYRDFIIPQGSISRHEYYEEERPKPKHSHHKQGERSFIDVFRVFLDTKQP